MPDRHSQPINQYDYINFDKPVLNDRTVHEFVLEEDLVNMGFWLMTYHPNFFKGSEMAKRRYFIWIFNTIMIFILQLLISARFMDTAIADLEAPNRRRTLMKTFGPAVTYKGFLESIF